MIDPHVPPRFEDTATAACGQGSAGDPRRLSSEAVALVVKRRSKEIGLQGVRYSGHSLRAGFVTTAAIAGVPIWKIKAQTGHASEAALGRYIRNCELFAANPMSAVL